MDGGNPQELGQDDQAQDAIGQAFCLTFADADPDDSKSARLAWLDAHPIRPGTLAMQTPGMAEKHGANLLLGHLPGQEELADRLMLGLCLALHHSGHSLDPYGANLVCVGVNHALIIPPVAFSREGNPLWVVPILPDEAELVQSHGIDDFFGQARFAESIVGVDYLDLSRPSLLSIRQAAA